jgi:acyl-CoA thioester hydrolase
MAQKAHTYRVRVRYADVDRMGIAYHTRYIEWFEAARTEMLRNMGLPYKQLEEGGLFLPVVEAECRYLIPARYDEVVEVLTFLNAVNRLTVELSYEVRNAETSRTLAKGRTLHCFTNEQGKPVRAERRVVELMKTNSGLP